MSILTPNVQQTVPGSDNIFTASGDVYVTSQPVPIPLSESRARKDLFTLLDKVKTFWIEGVLDKSIHNAVLLDLGKEIQPGAVDHPWESVLEVPESASRTLPRGINIGDLFDQSNHGLLILGDPGSGKTITLLELARELIARVENDKDLSQPIPVVFNLSTWNNPRLSLVDWLISELSVKYQVPKRISRPWLESNRLLYLLDGLDEVKLEYRAACVEAINKFEKEFGLAGLTVCCRREEYTNIPVRLKLNAAIRLQPLTLDQVNEYLSVAGSRLDGLRSALKEDETLLSLAESPLMLSVMSLAYQDVSAESLSEHKIETAKERRRHLFDSYVQRMFKRKGQGKKPYEQEQTLKWLSWLAQNLIKHKQTVFLIEQLQPSWLPSRGSQWGYALLSRIMAGESLLSPFVFLVVLVLMLVSIIESVSLLKSGVIAALIEGSLTIVLGFVLIFVAIVVPVGLVILPPFFILGMMDGLQFHRNQEVANPKAATRRQIILGVLGTGLLFTVYCGGINVLPTALLFTFSSSQYADPVMASLFTISSSSFWLGISLMNGLSSGIFGALVFGFRRISQTLAQDIYTTEFIGWSWRKALKGGAIGLTVGFLITVPGGWLLSLMMGNSPDFLREIFSPLLSSISIQLLSILSYAFAGVLIGGLNKGIVEGKSLPNQGIRLSIRNSIVAGLIGAIGGTLAYLPAGQVTLPYFITFLKDFDKQMGGDMGITSPSFGLLLGINLFYSLIAFGIIIGLGLSMWFGWRDVIHHYTLRFFLWRNGKTPRKYARFLDYAADLIFLRKVGGGYIFIHRLLMEYFAELNNAGEKV